MKGIVYETILFSLLVCNIKVAAQGCAEGEPKIGDPQPDLNITVLPSTRIPVGTNITVICDADYPRLLNPGNTNVLPLPPIQISIFIGDKLVKTCKNNPALNCRYIIPNVNKTIPRKMYCRTRNSGGECRFKFLELQFINGTTVTTSRPTEIETTTNQGGNGVSPILMIVFGSVSVIAIAFAGFIFLIFVYQ